MKTQIVYSPYASKAIAEAEKQRMRFRVIGQGEVPAESFYEDEWWYEILESESTIPADLEERVRVIKDAGIPIVGMVIAHEAPRLLTAPKEEEKPINVSFDALPVLEAITAFLGAVLAVVGLLLVTAIRLDPALIVVLEDGTWLEVATWYD